ncbi:hypothetical protein D9M69_694010 [compost metagenome]
MPAFRASTQASVLLTAAQFEFSKAMRVVWTVCASANPASLARLMAPVASESTSVLKPINSASTAEARMQLLVMYPTKVTVSTSCCRSHSARSVPA